MKMGTDPGWLIMVQGKNDSGSIGERIAIIGRSMVR
jgi:hypothetical protein